MTFASARDARPGVQWIRPSTSAAEEVGRRVTV